MKTLASHESSTANKQRDVETPLSSLGLRFLDFEKLGLD